MTSNDPALIEDIADPDNTSGDNAAPDEVYMSEDQLRLARFALRYTVPSALASALVIATIHYLYTVGIRGSSISWYGVDSASFIQLYVPPAFLMPIVQGPIVLRRTLKARVAGSIDPPLESLDGVGWLRWGLGLGVIVGSVWATIVVGIAAVMASWLPGLHLSGASGLVFRILLTTAIALCVGVLCAQISVLLRVDDTFGLPAGVSSSGTGASSQRSRVGAPLARLQRLMDDRWRMRAEPEVLTRSEAAVYFSGAESFVYLRRFFILLTLSIALVVLGLQSNSAVVVVAGVIVAPLMTPIMGLTLALVTGRPRRQVETLALVMAATGFIFVMAWFVSSISPGHWLTSAILLDFTDPRLTDVLIALVAGAVGIYCLVHTESSLVLPGVAIGLSLEPPLAAAGMMMAQNRPDLVGSAFLLFLVNLAAILAAGSLVLVLSGFLPGLGGGALPRRVKVGLTVSVLMVVLLAIPLVQVSRQVWSSAREASVAKDVVTEWAAGTDLEIMSIRFSHDQVIVELTGTDEPPRTSVLADHLVDTLGRDVSIDVRIYPYIRYTRDSD